MRKLFWGLLFASLLPLSLQAATISGTVSQQGGDTAIADARVILRQGQQGIDTVMTSAEGAFSFTEVDSGNYSVAVSKSGFQSSTRNATIRSADTTLVLAISLTLIPAPGKLTGTVTDSAGTPIPNARVLVSRRSGGFSTDSARTNAAGEFAFDSLTSGTGYTVAVSASPFMNLDTAGITLPAGETLNLALTMRMEPAPTAEIMGTAQGDSTQPELAGVMVFLRQRASNGGPWQIIDSMVTGEDGKYDFKALRASAAAGSYSLLGTKAGFNNGTSQTINLGAGQLDTVNLTLMPIYYGTLVVVVENDTTHEVLKGASITIRANSGSSKTGVTGENGIFKQDSLLTGNYTVTASLDGYVAKSGTRSVTHDGSDTLMISLTQATDSNSKSISGVVTDSTDKAIEGVTVTLVVNGQGGVRLQTVTDAEGKYSLTGIPATATNATVTFSKSGYSSSNANVALTDAALTRDVTLRNGFTAILRAFKSHATMRRDLHPGIYQLPNGTQIHINGSSRPIIR